MRRPKRWVIGLSISTVVLALALVTVVLCFTVTPAAFQAVLRFSARVAPIVAAVIAALALMLAAWSAFSGVRQRKRQVTLNAWSTWSDASRDARRLISQHLGETVISDAIATALVDKTPLVDVNGATLTTKQHRQVRNSVATVMNGLERIAVGVHEGIYDIATIVRLGGTIVTREYDRLEPYVTRLRETPHPTRRQQRAFVELQRLANEVRERRIDEDRLRSLRG